MIRRLGAGFVALLLAFGPTGAGRAVATTPTSDSYSVLEDQTLTVAAPGVLANDDPLPDECVAMIDAPVHGTADLQTDGGLTYEPEADYNGSDGFSYLVIAQPCDTGIGDVIPTVTITVTPVNDPPTVAGSGGCGSGNVAVQEDSGAYDSSCVSITSFGPANESGQAFAEWVIGAESTIGFSSGPTIATNGDLRFTPNANECGTANLSVAARDNGGVANGGVDTSAAVAFSITVACVNDAPTAAPDSFQALKDRTLNVNAPGVLINDDDIDSSPLSAVKVSNPSHGAVTLAADGSFSYTPASGYTGTDTFSYRASDGSLASPIRVVTLTVTNIPAVPTPTPIPTAVPTVEPTATPEGTFEDIPSLEPEPSPTEEASAVAEITPAPAVSAAPTPAASADPGPTGDEGGISLPVLLVIVLFVLLVGFGAALYLPKWLAAQRGDPPDIE